MIVLDIPRLFERPRVLVLSFMAGLSMALRDGAGAEA